MSYQDFKELSITGRYVNHEMLKKKWLSKLDKGIVNVVGKSVQESPIESISLGSGPHKILMWSQMHGNESTTTKAVLDLVNFLLSYENMANIILEHCSLLIVPMLNPDGSGNYTRVNANEIDLNRDAKEQSQPESRVLRNLFEEFQPDFCFNLHGQRTLFSAGNSDKPATVSFLSPASDEGRTVTPTRETAMKLIVAMNKKLQTLIPNQVGRYDDGFNDNCVGDSFHMLGVPTILFEAGHFAKDYNRERTREFIFHALIESLRVISEGTINDFDTSEYFEIPENQKLFYDVLIKNAHRLNSKWEEGTAIGIRYKEVLKTDKIEFVPEISATGRLENYYGHATFDCSNPQDITLLEEQKEVYQLVR